MPQIYDMRPTALLPLRRKACWEFFRPKNPTVSTGFEPANLGTKGQNATPRPPKPIFDNIGLYLFLCIITWSIHTPNIEVLCSNKSFDFISVINQLDAHNFCFTISLFHASACFEHMCSKHVEPWNKLIVKQKFCASSWLITEINILRCTVSKTSKKGFDV